MRLLNVKILIDDDIDITEFNYKLMNAFINVGNECQKPFDIYAFQVIENNKLNDNINTHKKFNNEIENAVEWDELNNIDFEDGWDKDWWDDE